ncbi:MAG TPA: hypothetical protein DCG37_02950 [Lachnospiraceae bacterium]|nr:hypothetical protein [Lachnospiraceae bacterium]
MEVKSYIARKIDRYVELVICQLPRNERKEAKARLENNIYAMLESAAGDRMPDSQDLQEILRELGTPDQTAAAYYVVKNRKEEVRRERRREAVRSTDTLMLVLRAFMIVSFVLLFCGLSGLILHTVSNVGMLFAGCAMALAVQFIREIVLMGKNDHFPRRHRKV